MAKTVLAAEDEEVWIEIDLYWDQEHRNAVLVSIRKDSERGSIFGALESVFSPGYSSIIGRLR